jgi:superfamily II DNA or RNA helicase
MSGYEPVFVFSGRWVSLDPSPPLSIVKLLVKSLSYVRKNSRFLSNPAWGVVKLYDEKRHRFPVGLLGRVKDLLDINHSNELIIDSKPVYDGLREYQQDALTVMLNNRCGIVKIPTGGGKTRITLNYIKSVNKSTLVLVPTRYLVKQWSEQVPEHAHVKTYASIKSKKYLEQFKVVILDECHHVASRTLFKIGMSLHQDAFVFGLSGTPLNRSDDNLKSVAVMGDIIYEISSKKLEELGFLTPVKVMYHELKPDNNYYLKYSDAYESYVLNNEERNKKIVDVVKYCHFPCLILVNLIEHGERLKNELLSRGFDVVFINGKSSYYDTNHEVIIATSVFDEGVDLPDLRSLVLGGGGKSEIKVIQRVGRMRRISENKSIVFVHDFVDKCQWLDDHFEERKKIFIEEGYSFDEV